MRHPLNFYSPSRDGVPVVNQPHETHPLGSNARVLLSSVFGPFGRDDEFGSRKLNPMELWHNQVTRVQGPFSLRMFNRSWGLMMIQANIDAPCALLDFPSLDRFTAEIRDHPYDIVGISAIPPNVLKVAEMCRLVRLHLPAATIVVGGHVANIPDLDRLIDADWIVRGEGVRWFRAFLDEDVDQPIRHPTLDTCIGTRTMGNPAGNRTHRTDGHADSVRRLSARVQLLRHLGHVRRQGPVSVLLRHRRRAFRRHVPARGGDEGAILLS